MTQTIVFNNKRFPIRDIKINNNEVSVSTIDLNDEIINEKGEYTSELARMYDDDIFYYVKKDEILLPDEQLTIILNSII